MIDVKNICKNFGELHALKNVTFSIKEGSLCGLVGPNGAGKSTLFKIFLGLLEANEGKIKIANETINFGDTNYKRKIGYAPESPQLYDYLTEIEFLQFIAAAKHFSGSEVENEIQKWINFFDLGGKTNELIKNYSQGMRRKISLCAALIGDPPILFLDEATNGLDPESSYKFKEYLRSYCQNGGTVLFSSHIIETVEYLCDRIIILHKGQIKQELKKNEWEDLRGQDSSLEEMFIGLVRE
ncbi:ABC transporter ATP-binding protein [candidate division KSB1 bacterium]|nr:ABC transporter ATP-binding protein [candidate division KSB1 bacterium]